jgi:hypothetical protein
VSNSPGKLQFSSRPASFRAILPSMDRYRGDINRHLITLGRASLATQITGGPANPGKMPESAWGIPATRCKLGSTLVETKGSVCSICYARRGRYSLGQVKRKLDERYRGLQHPLWVPAMVFLIRWHVKRYFRWFDSGDLQESSHLSGICQVAMHTRDILHWLPTQEYNVVREFSEPIPDNLVIRLSAQMLDGQPPAWWPTTSTVYTADPLPNSHVCPALGQENYRRTRVPRSETPRWMVVKQLLTMGALGAGLRMRCLVTRTCCSVARMN